MTEKNTTRLKRLADKLDRMLEDIKDKEDGSTEITIRCIDTDTPIYLVLNGKRQKPPLSSWGECRKCKIEKSIDALYTGSSFAKCAWPVVYVGFTCKKCYKNKT